MSQQNIYDNSTFFEGYKKIREKKSNANDLFETPALFSLLPDLQGKTILDLGCGVGGHCFEFVNGGAKKYHRTFSSIINTLVSAGFSIEKLIEPIPTEELLLDFPDHRDLFHKPDFLLVWGRKM